ncbi:MAG: M28 family peptidase [Planctomycetes bacterium]|nr:M28 family peptidase [Planctomycetota bacterium]
MIPQSGCGQLETTDKFASDRDKNPPKEEPKPTPEPKGDRFAADRAPPEVKAIPFDGKRAMQYLKDLCAIGPRISGSEGMTKQQTILIKHFEKHGAKVVQQKFEGKQPSQRNAVPMVNLIVTWNPEAKRRVIFCGHYDTRPIADQEPRERDWHKPFLSANDGTSTVAFFMELAHHMKDIPLQVGLDFVIFDGEEFMYDSMRDRFFLGSIHFADQYKKEPPAHRYIAAVLLDLFAGKDAKFPIEVNSFFLAAEVVDSIWKEAKTQGVNSFVLDRGHEVQDDHLALNRVGIPAIDIIDFDYPHWHKLTDLPEHCSGDKMTEVAKVLTAWVQRLK